MKYTRKLLRLWQANSVIIRTLDIGADKQADYFESGKRRESGDWAVRAIRICLTRPEIFKTQLRALFRASAYGNIAIMYPMITSLSEICTDQGDRGRGKSRTGCSTAFRMVQPEQGIMIETPAAVILSVMLLAKEVDFFSIGTNDLTQYTLAIDRQNQSLDAFFDAHHIAVLRMIYQTVQNAHKAGIWCGICGELGADSESDRVIPGNGY